MSLFRVPLALILLLLVLSGPILYFFIPHYYLSPDILYVKAKTIWVMSGNLYTDPVTGFPTFHPPYYHLFLSLFVRLGIGIDFLLIAVSILNVGLLILFAFMLLEQIFDSRTALFTIWLIPFINHYMGPNYLFLASSFSFSVPLYLAGLWLYTKKEWTILQTILSAILWGCAFLVSPGYLFLIVFTFAYELFLKRRYRRFIVLTVVFMLTIIPFFFQAYAIRRLGLMQTSVFGLWRGIPDPGWLQAVFGNLLSPMDGNLMHWYMVPVVAMVTIGLIGLWRLRPVHAFPAIAALAYLFTMYHFNTQYATRIIIFLSLFLAAYGIRWLLSFESKKRAISAIIIFFILLSLGEHVFRTISFYNERMERYTLYDQQVPSIMAGLGPYVKPDDFVLAESKTYRRYIMPNFLVHGLLAYRSGEYYQLDTRLADDMLRDYTELMENRDPQAIDYLCNKYGMAIAVLSKVDEKKTVFDAISRWWIPVYDDKFFSIYRRPQGRINPEPKE